MGFDFELLGLGREGGSDERTRSPTVVSSQFDLLSGSRFEIATLGKRYLFSHRMADIIAIDDDRRDAQCRLLPTSTASDVSTNAGTPPLENVSRI